MTQAHDAPPVAAPDLDAAIAALRGRGLRVSAARRLVLEVLYGTTEPLTAEQVAAGLRGRSDIASVYRNLEALEAIGLVRHFHLGHGPGLYVQAGLGRREYLACETCGRVRVVEPEALDAVRDRIRHDHGWEAVFTHFPISGLCPDCAERRLRAVDGDAHS